MRQIRAERWVKGRTPITARRLNAMLDLVRGAPAGGTMLHGPALHAVETGRETIITQVGDFPRGLPAVIQAFAVMSVEDDYLVCRPYYPAGGSVDGVDVYVAKPYLLQKTPFDGIEVSYDQDGAADQDITYTYTGQRKREADDGSDTEDQVMTPDYVTDVDSQGWGEMILAVQVPTNVVLPAASVTSTSWAAATGFAVGARIQPTTPNDYWYQCVATREDDDGNVGISGSGEPGWPTTRGESCVDGLCVWVCQEFYIDWMDINIAGRFWAKEA